MNDQMIENEDPPDPLAVRHRPSTGEWFVWSSFSEKPISKMYTTKASAEAVLANLKSRRA